jgi:predicted unusual protein kinase regulating ubiquinone biosynthesis (AarF/ABC1/UbiB family)
MGQFEHASYRVGSSIARELTLLQTVLPYAFEDARVVEDALIQTYSLCFCTIDPESVAAGSLSQVLKAIT